MNELCDLSAVHLSGMIRSKEISPAELIDNCIDRIESCDGKLNAMVTKNYERAKEEAKLAERKVLDGHNLGLLHGLPVGVKDLELTQGLRTTLGSKLYANYIPEEDQGSVAKIRAEGGILLGKTNTPEFGAGANTRNLVFGATGNPFDTLKTCGGSSGGSAVALATGMVPIATGSDYGGSLRTPASFCGVVGIRPSPGVVPAEARPVALLPFSVLGPMARTVDDAYLLLQAQSGVNRLDPFSNGADADFCKKLEPADLSNINAMITPDLGSAVMSKKYRSIFAKRAQLFSHNFKSVNYENPNFENGDNCFEILRGVNFVAAHGQRVRNNRKELSPNVLDNVDRGRQYTLEDVAVAHLQQSKISRDWINLLNRIDVVICPATATTPFLHSEWSVNEIDDIRMDTYMRWLGITYLPTMALACGVTIPCGLDHASMPFGIQVLGAPGDDSLVIAVAKSIETVLSQNSSSVRPIPNITQLQNTN
ncbi:amidase [Paracoccaceae bacterium]|nr:amidase [Paracoccaceae bacterium]